MWRIASAVALVALAATLSIDGAWAQAVDGRLKNILASKTIKIAYRTDGAPFSFLNSQQQPTGYIVDICKSVVSSLEKQFNVRGNLKIEWVPVTPQTRFQTVSSGKADMECGASTVTLGRMKQVDFSNFVFVESTGVIAKTATGANKFADLGGKKIAVIAGTTNEQVIKTKLQQLSLDAPAVSFRSRDEAVAALDGCSLAAGASRRPVVRRLWPRAAARRRHAAPSRQCRDLAYFPQRRDPVHLRDLVHAARSQTRLHARGDVPVQRAARLIATPNENFPFTTEETPCVHVLL